VKRRVVGGDLSLTSSGVSDGHHHFAVQTSNDEVTEARLDRILRQFMSFVLSGPRPADLVVLEGAAHGAVGNARDQLAGLRWLIRHRLHRARVPFAIVTPTSLKMYTAGYGRASKRDMYAAVKDRHGLDLSHVKVTHGRYDMVDAYALAAMGYDHLDEPLNIEPLSEPARRKTLANVTWPTLISD